MSNSVSDISNLPECSFPQSSHTRTLSGVSIFLEDHLVQAYDSDATLHLTIQTASIVLHILAIFTDKRMVINHLRSFRDEHRV